MATISLTFEDVTLEDGSVAIRTTINHDIVITDENRNEPPTAAMEAAAFALSEHNRWLTLRGGRVQEARDAATNVIAGEPVPPVLSVPKAL